MPSTVTSPFNRSQKPHIQHRNSGKPAKLDAKRKWQVVSFASGRKGGHNKVADRQRPTQEIGVGSLLPDPSPEHVKKNQSLKYLTQPPTRVSDTTACEGDVSCTSVKPLLQSLQGIMKLVPGLKRRAPVAYRTNYDCEDDWDFLKAEYDSPEPTLSRTHTRRTNNGSRLMYAEIDVPSKARGSSDLDDGMDEDETDSDAEMDEDETDPDAEMDVDNEIGTEDLSEDTQEQLNELAEILGEFAPAELKKYKK